MDFELIKDFFSPLGLLDYSVLAVNIILIVFARPLLERFSSGNLPQATFNFRLLMLRGLNLVIIIVYGYEYLFLLNEEKPHGLKLLSILAIMYLAYLVNYITQYYIHKYYGKAREINGSTTYIETYQTRLFSILSATIITLFAVISIIDQLEFDSMLEAGGALGVMGIMIGLTQAAWAPDIISGLIILNSDMLEEGDIVEIDSGILGRIYKTKLFHTEILNISNNHRVMIRNAHMRDKIIHNLSKFASAKGLRECLSFNIGYDTPVEAIKEMFEESFTEACEVGIPMESQYPAEIKVLQTADHAVCWGILFYVKKVEQIVNIRRDFRELILLTSEKKGISLATPFTHYAIKDAIPGL